MMRRIQAILTGCLGVLLLSAPVGMARAAAPAGTPVRLSPESWHAEPRAGMLLVATRELQDPTFAQSVILLLSHGIAGSQGLIVNQQSQWQLSDVLTDIDAAADEHPLFFGGPLGVHQVFMLMRGDAAVPGALQVKDDIWFSNSRRVFDDLLADPLPAADLRFYLGYASWTTGQLALEIQRGSWLLVKGETGIVFDPAGSGLWERLIDELEPNGILVSVDPLRRPRIPPP
jgi:putative transcriptional regulator